MRNEGRLALAAALCVLLSGCAAQQALSVDQPAHSPSPTTSPSPAGEVASGGAVTGIGNPVTTDYSALNESIARCLRDRGWDAAGSIDRVESGAVPLGQEDRYQADYEACASASDGLLPATAPVDDALYALNFERVLAARSCLQSEGYQVPGLVSEQVWRDNINSSVGYPLFTTDPRSIDDATAMRELCPEPDSVFFSPEIEIYPELVDYAAYWASTDYVLP